MASTFMEDRQIPLTYFGDLTNQRASIEANIAAPKATSFGERSSVSSSSKKLTNNNVIPKRKKAASHVTSPAKIPA